ncbi:hypothetical protein ACSBR1_004868 [Camellia fascicularis]
MEMVTEVSALTELVVSLEQATLMAKQLPNTTDPSQILQIHSSLHSAHLHLSSFLSQSPPQPSLPLPPPPSAAAAAANDNDEPMQDDDDDDEEIENSNKTAIDRVEERMKDCFIQNKRPKRPLSPSSRRRWYGGESVRGSEGFEFDPQGTKLRALDLVYQFHG